MNYEQLIEKAMNGRTTYAMAKKFGMSQVTLSKYLSGERMPDYETGLRLAKEADVSLSDAFETLAEAARIHKSKQFKLQSGFVQITPLLTMAAVGATILTFYIM